MSLNSQLEKAQQTRNAELDTVEQISYLRDVHKGVIDNIDHVKGRTEKILQGKTNDQINIHVYL